MLMANMVEEIRGNGEEEGGREDRLSATMGRECKQREGGPPARAETDRSIRTPATFFVVRTENRGTGRNEERHEGVEGGTERARDTKNRDGCERGNEVETTAGRARERDLKRACKR